VILSKKMTMVSAGKVHSLALAEDGTVWAWGDNYNGQIGNGTDYNTNVMPAQVSGLPSAPSKAVLVAVAPGMYHYGENPSSYAVMDDGVMWAWGSNSGGQLGYGPNQNHHLWNHPLPVRISYFTGELTGHMNISHSPRIGDRLGSYYVFTGNAESYTLSFLWTADNVPVGTNSSTYVLTEAELGKIMKLTVTSSEKTGSISASSANPVDRRSNGTLPGLPELDANTWEHHAETDGRS
jgi:hypothetical protein